MPTITHYPTAAQSGFNAPAPVTAAYVNGRLVTHSSAYAANGGYTITLSSPAARGDQVDLRCSPSLKAIAPPGLKFLTAYGVTAFDWCRNNTYSGAGAIGVTTLTHVISNERPRFSTYTRKCTMSSAAAEIRLGTLPLGIFADPVDKSFSIDVFIESMPSEFNGVSNPSILVSLSNTTALGSNFSKWTFGANYIRQGWNTLVMRADDTVSSSSTTASEGNLPYGAIHPVDAGTGFDWNTDLRFVSLLFSNMDTQVVHVDQIRRAAKARPVLVMGFDAIGATGTDDVLRTKVAPLFKDVGIKGYTTMTNVFDLVFSGGLGWQRAVDLQNDWGWDAIPHTWSHGATAIGRLTTLTSLVFSVDVGTATFPAVHGIPLGQVFKAKITGASIGAANIVGEFTATTTTTAIYTATGAGTATATGTITLNTMLSEVLNSDTAENRRIALQEIKANADSMRGTGFERGSSYMAYPNNSVMHLDVLQYACAAAGVKLGRGARGGYAFVNEFGLDNPLNFGSFIMDSGTSLATQTSFIQAKVLGAVTRGAHIHIFGHFILDDEDPANAAYFPVSPNDPPGQNGNPAPPSGAALSGTGGWWYLSQLRKLVNDTIKPLVQSGQLLVMSPSEYVEYMGYFK